MLTVTVLCVGRLKERYLKDGVDEYRKRLGAFCRPVVLEVDEERLPDNPSPAQIEAGIAAEGGRILPKIPAGAYLISLCIEGKGMSSPQLAETIASAAVNGTSQICFVIGGSFGLWDRVKAKSHLCLSMSAMTFPHQLARLMLCEQIYRAFQIQTGGKYHK